MAQFYSEREVRTPNGECYTILENGKPIGRLDLHFVPGLVQGTMVVSESQTQDTIQELMSMVDQDLTDAVGIERDDLVIHVHQGRDLGVFTPQGFHSPRRPRRNPTCNRRVTDHAGHPDHAGKF